MEEYRNYFKGNERLLRELERLHEKKYYVKELVDSEPSFTPFVTEFSGLPRTGKSSSVDRIYEFFKMAGFRIERTTEPAQILKDSMTKGEIDKLSNLEFNHKTLEISKEELNRRIAMNPTIVLQDRGVIDNYFW